MSRTQRERRETTIAKLIDAAMVTIAEKGYVRASVKTIATEAGMSYGALFRHFETTTEFMIAVAEDAFRRQLEVFDARFQTIPEAERTIEAVLRLQYEIAGNSTNTVIYELQLAARTDEQLRAGLQPALVAYGSAILQLALKIIDPPEELDPADFMTAVFMISDMFDAEHLFRHVRPYPELTERRIQLLATMIGSLIPPEGSR
ncbi:TetR/AcrR family transcriptional regulator [Nocardia sp. NPDC056100]|uniref:TetR/AcrR family transcriptional regulator n=1 Tax=Nocardia sp. NPDC056100 TaxID=3345712 RepID=UPI0035DA13B2